MQGGHRLFRMTVLSGAWSSAILLDATRLTPSRRSRNPPRLVADRRQSLADGHVPPDPVNERCHEQYNIARYDVTRLRALLVSIGLKSPARSPNGVESEPGL